MILIAIIVLFCNGIMMFVSLNCVLFSDTTEERVHSLFAVLFNMMNISLAWSYLIK